MAKASYARPDEKIPGEAPASPGIFFVRLLSRAWTAVPPLSPAWWVDECGKVPHTTLRPDPYTGRLNPVSTEDRRFVAEARHLVKDVAEGRCKLEPIPDLREHFQLCQEVAAAADARDAEIKAIDERLGDSVAQDRYDAAVDEMCRARDVLIEMPAPDGDALLCKRDWLFFTDHIWADDFVSRTVADARQMLGGLRRR